MSEKVISNQFEEKVESFEIEQRENILGSGEKVANKNMGAERTINVISPEKAAESAIEANQEGAASQQLLEQFNQAAEDEPKAIASATSVDPKARQAMAKREIKSIQKQETFRERTLSRVIHQPVIRVVSEAAGNTISRPSGLLGGGLAAFLGSGSYLILAKYLHFTYNYSVSLAFFVGGFLIGLALELTAHSARHRDLD